MKVSIIIPVYNKNKYLRTLLQQVKDQTFEDYECLLIDDGSSDGSEVICDEFAAKDARFKVFHIPNGGVSHARNVGLDHAEGKYVTFVDADDEIALNYLENLHTCIARSKAYIVVSGYQKFWDYEKGTILVKHPNAKGNMPLRDCLSDFALVQRETGLFGCCVSKMFKRELALDVRYDESLRLAEDFDFYLRLYEKVQNIYFDDQCLYRYRQVAENSSAIINDEKIDYFAQLKINLRYRECLKRLNAYEGENKAIVEGLLSNYLYFSAFYCPKERMNVCLPELARLQQHEGIRFVSGRKLQKTVLSLLGNGHWKLVKFLISCYKALRIIIKRIRLMCYESAVYCIYSYI